MVDPTSYILGSIFYSNSFHACLNRDKKAKYHGFFVAITNKSQQCQINYPVFKTPNTMEYKATVHLVIYLSCCDEMFFVLKLFIDDDTITSEHLQDNKYGGSLLVDMFSPFYTNDHNHGVIG